MSPAGRRELGALWAAARWLAAIGLLAPAAYLGCKQDTASPANTCSDQGGPFDDGTTDDGPTSGDSAGGADDASPGCDSCGSSGQADPPEPNPRDPPPEYDQGDPNAPTYPVPR